jgi:hypothetical protein
VRPIIAGNTDSLDWLIAEGESDAARLIGLLGPTVAVMVLPTGAKAFQKEWAQLIPRGASIALCHDADADRDAGAAKAARIIGGKTMRVRPPEEGSDWCDWPGDRAELLALMKAAAKAATAEFGWELLEQSWSSRLSSSRSRSSRRPRSICSPGSRTREREPASVTTPRGSPGASWGSVGT